MGDERSKSIFDFILKGKDINSEEHPSQAEDEYQNDFDRFMFGKSRETVPKNSDHKKIENGFLGQIDLNAVLDHVDTLMTSARELKPIIGKVKPYLNHFIDKHKS